MIIPDVNLLVYAANIDASQHVPARTWWEQRLRGTETVALPWAVTIAFLRLVTNSRIVASPISFGQASGVVDGWLARPVVTVVTPTRRHTAVMRDLLAPFGAAHNLVPDAHLAALAIEHGAELCSADNDFSRFPGLSWHNPLITP